MSLALSTLPLPTLMLSGLRGLGKAALRVVKAMENRRAARALMHLDARSLADIGLTREAVEGVFANSSAFEDPSNQLSRIATRRGSVPAGQESAPPR